MLMPAIEMSICASYNDFLQITGGYYAQHYAQSFGTSNYLDYSQFTMSATRSSSTYTQFATLALNNIATVLEKSAEDEDYGTALAATTLRVFVYQVLVDMYGEIPYSESLDLDNLSPKYDDGKDIYYGILDELDAALAMVDSDADSVCDNFLFGTSDVDNWVSFANALKLRILMRMSDKEDVQTQLDTLVAEDNFPTSDVAFTGIWSDASGQANPFYQEEFATYFGSTQVNCIANVSILRTLDGDPRQATFFAEGGDFGYTYGGVSGSNLSTGDIGAGDLCRPNVSYDSPAVLISVCETEFLLAEYYAEKDMSTEAQAHYEAAIEASFDMSDTEGASSIYTGSTYKWDDSKAIELIGIQKWIALAYFNSFEAWCELRRLGYPEFDSSYKDGESIFDESDGTYDDSIYTAGTLYTPTKVDSEVGSYKTIQRFKYPESSTSTNSNAPSQQTLDVPVFWAKLAE